MEDHLRYVTANLLSGGVSARRFCFVLNFLGFMYMPTVIWEPMIPYFIWETKDDCSTILTRMKGSIMLNRHAIRVRFTNKNNIYPNLSPMIQRSKQNKKNGTTCPATPP